MGKTLIWSSAVSVIMIVAGIVGTVWLSRHRSAAKGEYRTLSLAELSFPYHPPPKASPGSSPPGRPDPFPARIRALEGAKVSILGYMAPLTMKAGRIDNFYLSRGAFGCCYADAPGMTDYVRVSMAPGRFAPNVDLVRVNGMLEVGEERNSLGYVETLYRLRAEAVRSEEMQGSGWVEAAIWIVGGLFFLALVGPVGLRLLKSVRERWRVVPALTGESKV